MEPRIYRLAPELRRSAIIAMAGSILSAFVAYWSGFAILERDQWTVAALCALFGVFFIAMIAALRWALYVDVAGVTRRRWLFFQDHWSWSDFASGRIRKLPLIKFNDPQRAFWFDTLDISGLADGERKELIQLINHHYQLPDAPALPEMLQINYGFRRRAEFTRHEIRLNVRGETQPFKWNDVQRVRITRIDPLRRDFAGLTLRLPGHEIELKCETDRQTWSGASAEELNELLLACVAGDRIDIDIKDERPARAEYAQKELEFIKTNDRQFRYCMMVLAFLFAANLTWMAIDYGAITTLFVSSTMAGMLSLFVPVYWLANQRYRMKERRLEMWKSELEGAPDRNGHCES